MRSGFFCLARGLTGFYLFVVTGHGEVESFDVTPVEIPWIARLKALSTSIFVNPGTDFSLGVSGNRTI
jgi:hypothetical protein